MLITIQSGETLRLPPQMDYPCQLESSPPKERNSGFAGVSNNNTMRHERCKRTRGESGYSLAGNLAASGVQTLFRSLGEARGCGNARQSALQTCHFALEVLACRGGCRNVAGPSQLFHVLDG